MMHLYRAVDIRLDRDEWFDAIVPTEGSNATTIKPQHQMQVRHILIQDFLDGDAPEVRAQGRRYRADGRIGEGGTADARLQVQQLPPAVRFAVDRILRTYPKREVVL